MSVIERQDVTDEELGNLLFGFQEALFEYLGLEGVMGFPDKPWNDLHKVSCMLRNGFYDDLEDENNHVP